VVLKDASDAMSPRPPSAELVRELTESCRHTLAAHKVPALIRIVPTLEISAAGKLVRPLA
jgi:acyl-CoA synthetase (AMP-forming)/AMP-acid ligase II